MIGKNPEDPLLWVCGFILILMLICVLGALGVFK